MGNHVKEIAARAGVSIATVSRVLNGKLGHRPETVLRVKASADALERENAPMRQRGTVSNAIGFLVHLYGEFICNIYTAALLDGVVTAAATRGYGVMLLTVTESTCNLEYVRNMVAFYRLKGVVIPCNHYLYNLADRLAKELQVPAVSINAPPGGKLPNIRSDARRRGVDAANCLLNSGHRRVALVVMGRDADHRQISEGFCETFRSFAPEEKVRVWEYFDTEEPILHAVNTILNRPDPPTALFFANSRLARRFYLALCRRGVRIPEDISFLSSEENGELIDLGISTLAQPTHRMGEAAAKLLLRLIHHTGPEEREEFLCSLHERASVQELNQGQSRFRPKSMSLSPNQPSNKEDS